MSNAATRKRNREKREMSLDSWVNTTTGVGGPADKSANFSFFPGHIALWDDYRLEDLYEADDIAGRIVDTIPNETFKRGFSVKISSDDPAAEETQGLVDDWRDRLKLRDRVQEAMKWARLFGGAAILIGAEDGQPPYMPLDESRIRRVHFLTTFERRELQPHTWEEDPLTPNFGEPTVYRVTPISNSSRHLLYVHRSRLILFHGVRTTRRKQRERLGFGTSVLLRCVKVLSQFQGAFASALALMADANQNVYAIKGLSDIIKSGNTKPLETRLSIIDKYRSSIKAIAVDADGEQFIRSTLALTGVADILDKTMLRMTAAAELPVTVLMGQSPAGMNATGESDIRILNSRTMQAQRDEAKPAIERTMRLVFKASEGPTQGQEPKAWSVEFPSLWEPTAREEAEIANIHAQSDRQYFDMGIPIDAIAKARFQGEDPNGRIMLSDEDIALLGSGTTELPPTMTDPQQLAAVDALKSLAGVDDTQDVEDVDVDVADLAAESLAALCAKMTEHQVAECEHGFKNRCPKCGIERERDFEPGPEGPVWNIKWRPIRLSA